MIRVLLLSLVSLVVPSDSQVITGRVTDAASGLAVDGALIIVRAQGQSTKTGLDGDFVIDAGQGETVEVSISHPCFHRVRVDVDLGEAADPLEIGLPFNYSEPGQSFVGPAGMARCGHTYGR